MKRAISNKTAVSGIPVRATARYHFAIPSTWPAVSAAVRMVRTTMEWMHYDDEWLFRAELCLHEALLNAYQHGNERNAWREIRVTCLLAANNVKIHVEDEGSGYNTAETTNLDALAADHGRGLYLIHQLMNSVRVSKDGKEIIMSLSKE